jgi:hypothetical protein
MPGIVTCFFPATDDVAAPLDFRNESRHLAGIILQIGVQREYEIALSNSKSRTQCGRFAEIAAQSDSPNPRIVSHQLLDGFPGMICRAIVDENEFEIVILFARDFGQLAMELCEAFHLVVHRNDGRQLHARIVIATRRRVSGL